MLHVGWPQPCPIRRGVDLCDSQIPRLVTLYDYRAQRFVYSVSERLGLFDLPRGVSVGHFYGICTQVFQGLRYPPDMRVSLYVCSFQYCCRSADSKPSRWPWVHIRVSRSARYFAATSIRPHKPPLHDGDGYSENGTLTCVPCYC